MKTISIILITFVIGTFATAQVIPTTRQVQWTGAGIFQNNPVITTELNVMNFGAHGDSIHDDAHAIDSAMTSLNGHAGIILFPPGNYLVLSTLNITDSVILRGDCYDSAQLVFNMGGTQNDCIDAQVNVTTTFQNIVAGFSKDTNVIVLDSVTGFHVGDYAEISETNGTWNTVPASWAVNCVGQIIHITAINGNAITFEDSLRITYTPSLNPQIRKWTPRVFVGIEDLRMTRVDTGLPADGYMMNFYNAMNCWVKGVESYHSCGAHVNLNVSTNITVSGCYFHDAYAYDGTNTRGYGVLMIQHTGQCLIENNAFEHLRHAVIVKQGANGNVAGYNFAINEYRVETPNDAGADLVCHGHYSFANLFEGNIVNNIMVDSTWGPTGPYTTFYRNRAALYGILMTPGASVLSDTLNFVGNETTDNAFLHGLYYLAGTNHYQYGNNILGTITPTGTTNLTDTSYYRTSFTDFFNTAPYPPTVGMPNVLGSGTVPAMVRYNSGGRVTVSPNAPCVLTGISSTNSNQDILLYPNPASNTFFVKMNNSNGATIEIFDLEGRIISSNTIPSGNQITEINTSDFSQGIYFVKLITDKVIVKKIAIAR
jgi:hypothetical protein